MQLGWIDFSKSEREKVLDVINLLSEEGAVDELGVGSIRDGFANIFFPGTSTVQTRAKYFLIVPYILAELEHSKHVYNVDDALRKLDDEERNCALKLLESSKDGVIGVRTLPAKWVVRKPSSIYWNGIKTFKIFKEETLTLPEYIKLSCTLKAQRKTQTALGNRNDEAEENEKDDKDAGYLQGLNLWKLPTSIDPNWKETLTIALSKTEAEFLKNQIVSELKGTLFSYILKNNIDLNKYDDFMTFAFDLESQVDEDLKNDLIMAEEISEFIYLARIRYNIILSAGENQAAKDEWDYYKNKIDQITDINLDRVYIRLGLKNYRLRKFIYSMKKLLITGDIDALDKLIHDREVELKGPERAKLNRIGELSKDAWIGGGLLDYRFTDAKAIINDIYEGEDYNA